MVSQRILSVVLMINGTTATALVHCEPDYSASGSIHLTPTT